ncbi:MAG TPA: helix-turn-helix domain-containing protein [bacterium]|nr:helix-turn-helix domain-containing protein [bacterium]HPT29785.1 helix-turn-helix domain-containing protein [bacterium]
MATFSRRPVLSEYKSIGDQLRLARLESGWSIEKVARQLKTKEENIRFLENEEYQKLPAGIYGQIFLKKYIEFLGLDYKKIKRAMASEKKIAPHPADDVFANKVVAKDKLMVFPKLLRSFLLGAIIIVCLLYLSFYLKKITTPPNLKIISPSTEKQVQSELSAQVVGQTEPESEVKINGQLILIDRSGAFSQTVSLKQGVNIIVVTAKKKYSREEAVTRQILVE